MFDASPIWISLKTALAATAVTFVIGILAARAMAGWRGRLRSVVDGLLMLPLVLPPSVVGFVLLVLFGRGGPLGILLAHFGLSVVFTWPATVIASTVVAFPLMYRTTLGAFTQIDSDLLHAARTLGASEGRILKDVMLPLAGPGILAGASLAFARGLGEFGATLMVAGDIPGVTQTIPIAVYFAVEGNRLEQAAIWSLIVVGITLVVIAAMELWSRDQLGWWRGSEARSRPAEDSGPPGADFSDFFSGIQERRVPQEKAPSRVDAAANLAVDIEKRLPGFSLQLGFRADRSPLGVLGVSGAGKSMTLRSIAGVDSPTRGRIVLNGRTLFDSERGVNLPARKRRVALLSQSYALFPHLTVAENVAFGLKGRPAGECKQRVSELIDRVRLRGFESRYPRELSGGQQQRVALARALAVEPEALLLDEPLSALDTHLRSQMEMRLMETIENYAGVTLYVTHNLEEAYRISTNLVVLSAGRVAACGPKEQVFRRPPSYAVARVTGCKNFSRAGVSGSGRVEATDWHCTLRVAQEVPDPLGYVGIRAHHLVVSGDAEAPNSFPCWLARAVETPFRMTLYLHLHRAPSNPGEHHLEAELFKDRWQSIKDRPFPWYVRLDPERLFLMKD
jgi:molybdate transport system ATP-binding protein/molybdate transport system permease protein